MHLISVQKEAVQDFTQTRWDTYRTNLQRWLHLQGESKEIAETFKHCVDINFDNIPEDAGFHATCYRRFIDKKRLVAAEKRVKQTPGEPGAADTDSVSTLSTSETPRKKLRSRTGLPVASAGHVLPVLCIICKKVDKYINVGGKRQKDTLSQATSLSAGLLQEAAEMKEDFSILLHIKDKDCVALEVRYHKTCYRDYTRFLSKTASKAEEENEPAFDASYKIFCERVIRQRLIVNHEVLKMNQLRRMFLNTVKKHEDLDASNYR
ncbi:hypothetical protein AAFF_G00142190 [Aldrovandia affinis]|uniref:Uncharacterized protein n=1 Tax=Aldrovandia affinis TaxID=143900 RepID=A0AAD7T167_9TELE|nr:hypothetical protein AAFF_G00142190 [Aldrovandia affinis]